MIKSLDTVEDVVKILKLDDDILEDSMPCTRGEWVQFLCQNIDNPKFKIIAEIEDNKIMAYLVLLDSVVPPVFDAAVVLYLWSPNSHKITRRLVEVGKKWVIKIGASRLIVTVPCSHTEKYMGTFETEKKAHVYEWGIKSCHL